MKIKNFQIFLIVLIFVQISTCFLVKRNVQEGQEKFFCFHSVCGWEIDKKNGLIEYVENYCKCKPEEQCLRTAKEYRLPGWKFHCKRPDDVKDSLEVVITFPPNIVKANSQTYSTD